jgi:hypothetical protein
VWQLLRGHYSAASILNTLPMDMLELMIAHLGHGPFSSTAPRIPAAVTADETEQIQSDVIDRSV